MVVVVDVVSVVAAGAGTGAAPEVLVVVVDVVVEAVLFLPPQAARAATSANVKIFFMILSLVYRVSCLHPMSARAQSKYTDRRGRVSDPEHHNL